MENATAFQTLALSYFTNFYLCYFTSLCKLGKKKIEIIKTDNITTTTTRKSTTHKNKKANKTNNTTTKKPIQFESII